MRWKAGAEPLTSAPSAAGTTIAASLDEPFLVQKERLVHGFETAYAKALLEVAKGNVSEAARRAGWQAVSIGAAVA